MHAAYRVEAGRAKELSLTGNYLSAEEAADWGLVNRIVPPEEFLPTCVALARDMASCDREVLRTYKRVMNAGYATTLREGLQIEADANRRHARRLTSDGIAARREAVQARGRRQSR